MNTRRLPLLLLILFGFQTFAFAQTKAAIQQDTENLNNLTLKMEDWIYKDIDSSRFYACQLMNLSLKLNDSLSLATAYTGLAYTYFYQSKLKEALEYLKVSHSILSQTGDSLDLSDTYMNFGNVYTEMGFFEKGIEFYQKAETYIPENSKWEHYNLAYLYYNTSQTFLDLGDLKNCAEYLKKSETNALKDSAYELLFAIKNVQAELLLKEGKYEEARKYAQLALNQSQDYNDLMEQAAALELLAQIQSQNGNHQKAISYQKESLEKAILFGDPMDIAKQYGRLSNVLLNAGVNKEALVQALKADEYAQKVKSQVLFKEISKVLAEAYEANNYSEKALVAYKTHYAYKDTISRVNINERLLQTQNQIQVQNAKYLKTKNAFQQSVIKQNKIVMIGIASALVLTLILLFALVQSLRKKRTSQQIIEEKQKLLNTKSQELNITNQKLKQLNDGKDKLFSILTHDLKQPFNQTLQLLEILEGHIIDDNDLQELINQVKESAEDTKATVDNLLIWSKSQFTNIKTEPKSVSLEQIANELQNEFRSTIRQKELEAQVHITPNLKVLADPNHLEIILRNLLQNAIKFSNAGGRIELKAEKDNELIYITIMDQGIGMDSNQLKSLFDINTHFSTPGTLNEKGTGLGMIIVADFIRENNGKLEVESKPNVGSTFKIILPAA